jgi:4-diphosphocytidyl-2-C-methyl-D-erythritol kinase
MGGGLAGGSSDAATALRLAARAWGLALSSADLARLGARLGADVPFFGADLPAALVTGIGESLQPLPALTAPVGVLLVTPPFGMATPAVFRMHDVLPPPGPAARRIVEDLARDWAAGLSGPDLADRAGSLRDANDLWPAALALDERLGPLRDGLERLLGRPVLMTGSGSTLVGLYPSPVTARAAADRIGSDPVLGTVGLRIRATSDRNHQLEDPHA